MSEYHQEAGYDDDGPMFISQPEPVIEDVDFEDPAVSSLPRILLMGPRRGGKTSIQVRWYCTKRFVRRLERIFAV